ncbi:8141_t:CDS:1, partial [Gigaspora rosea]
KAKFEQTEQGFLHFHNYLQFNNMVNMKNVKDMFEKNKEIIFLPGLLLKETLQENLDYISKIYKRCKIYYNSLKNQYCKYSLFDLNNF